MILSKKGTPTRRKNQQIGPYQPFEVSMYSSNILKLLFSDLATVKKHSAQSFRKNISGVESHLNVFGEQTLHAVFRLASY